MLCWESDNMVAPYDNKASDIEGKVLGFINHAENHPKYQHQRDRAQTCADFERGAQWTEEEYNRYKAVGVEPIMINRCLTTIKSLDGLLVENAQDITATPRKGAKKTSARVLTEIIKHAQDVGGFDSVKKNTFRKGNITTAGYIGIDVDKTKSANGQIVFQSYGFFDVMPDPDGQDYDMDKPEIGCKYIIVRKWIDKEALAAIHGEVGEAPSAGSGGMEAYIAAVTQQSRFYTEEEMMYRWPVYTVWWKEYVEGLLVTDKQLRRTRIVKDKALKAKVRKLAKNSQRFTFEPVAATILHKSTVINGKMLEDKPDPMGPKVDSFPIVRYVPIFREDFERGILDDVTSINYEENLRRTQVNRLLILTANAGWIVGDTTNQEAKAELQNFGSIPGFIADKGKFGGFIEKIKPNEIPGDFILAKQSATDIKEVTGLNAAMQGYDEGTKDEPGVVLEMRRKQGISSNSGLFDNFNTTLELLGNKILAILDAEDIYTEDEIRAIIGESDLIDEEMMQKAEQIIEGRIAGTRLMPPQMPQPIPQEVMLGLPMDQMVEAYQQMEAGIKGAQMYAQKYPALKGKYDEAKRELAIRMLLEGLYSSEVTQYGIKIVLSPNTPTARMAMSQRLMAIQNKYGFVPFEILAEYLDIPQEVKARIIQNQQAQMMAMMQQGAARQRSQASQRSREARQPAA
jgi:hypothetical protein